MVYLYLFLVTSLAALGHGTPSRCLLKPDSGLCRAYVPSFYYDPLKGACDCFVYGGCLGNENRFSKLDQCMEVCGVEPQLQKETTSCRRILREEKPLEQALKPQQPSPEVPSPSPEAEDTIHVGYHYLVPSLVYTTSERGTLFIGQPVWVPFRSGDEEDFLAKKCTSLGTLPASVW